MLSQHDPSYITTIQDILDITEATDMLQDSADCRNKGHPTNKCSDLQPSPIVLIVVAGGHLTFSLIADSGKLITV